MVALPNKIGNSEIPHVTEGSQQLLQLRHSEHLDKLHHCVVLEQHHRTHLQRVLKTTEKIIRVPYHLTTQEASFTPRTLWNIAEGKGRMSLFREMCFNCANDKGFDFDTFPA